ncbi:hypothetical protein EVG20_g6362 [Dentipellis fragilis]|uniref:SPX domain-containing protein n=1 Tax=Dentipellis fragilis TaxID=205917 RepID=A0A4Y9YLN5_9AGAM|nr:hypothetical protein EVG20_g6362 [Dentipellis fragilis]
MKFARYLDDAQTPEWKRAYMYALAYSLRYAELTQLYFSDYRGLKKRITAVRRSLEGQAQPVHQESSDEKPLAEPTRVDISDTSTELDPSQDGDGEESSGDDDDGAPEEGANPHAETSANGTLADRIDRELELAEKMERLEGEESQRLESSMPKLPRRDSAAVTFPPGDASAEPTPAAQPTPSTPVATGTPSRRFGNIRRRVSTIQSHMSSATLPSANEPITLDRLLDGMSPVHLAFFDKLDRELAKIESFYLAREQEARERSTALMQQLVELKDHRRVFYEAHPEDHHPWSIPFLPGPSNPTSRHIRRALHHRPRIHVRRPSAPQTQEHGKAPERDNEKARTDAVAANVGLGGGPGQGMMGHQNGSASPRQKFDPEDYQYARKKLKQAVLEFYRGLEVLNNYRILNLTGFRKALKKFEKLTGTPVQGPYMKEKVEPCAFASGDIIQDIVKEMEEQFAARFTRGDKKRALVRLRAGSHHKTHHFSTFRTGFALGLAIPALVDGIVRSFQPDTRAALPGWDSLLFIYSIILVPSLFSFLVGLNLLVWNRARINYVFIFELDIRTRLDHREYFEIPAVVLATLCYSFWLSFARVGDPHIAPTTWPLIWLLFVAGLLINPLPILFRESRWWLIRNVARLLTSGTHRVEFTDFWMGDQFCSFLFTMSNLYFFACAYHVGFSSNTFASCSTRRRWGVPFVLASLPLFGGKYGAGILYYLCYFIWRHNGAADRGASFAFFCLFGTIYAIYASSWDFLMDWSLLRPHAKYRLLRSELVYSSYIPLYYFAIITNVLIRFIWVIYIPTKGPSFPLRSWIAAMLEILRRWQWNFYRLENEHMGNMDQYRVTREVPLPYSFDEVGHESDGEEDGEVERDLHIPAKQ